MLLTLSTTYQPATDLSYLLHEHPDRIQTVALEFGQAHVFYPEASAERCTAALLLEIGDHAVDRPIDHSYVASAFLSIVIAKVFTSALSGHCANHSELANTSIPLTAALPVVPCREGERLIREFFEPLGYRVTARSLPLDTQFTAWGDSRYLSVTLSHTVRLSDLLSHLCVLIPALDEENDWFREGRLNQLLRYGKGWLADHPYKEQITQKYSKRKRKPAEAALLRLMEGEDPDADAALAARGWQKLAARKPVTLHQQRIAAVSAVLKSHNARRVIDLGCGEGDLLEVLLADCFFKRLTGVDVSFRALDRAKKKLGIEQIPMHQRERIQLMQGSLIYRDQRLIGYDAAMVIEVIEHLDLDKIEAFERVVFQFAQPPAVIITTPNAEFNVLFPTLEKGHLRHQDHRFEWTRSEFETWAKSVCKQFGYSVEFQGIGFDSPAVGTPCQMGVFTKQEER